MTPKIFFRYTQSVINIFDLLERINLENDFVFPAYCTARECWPLRRKFIECSVNSPALSLLIKHLVIGQRLKTEADLITSYCSYARPAQLGPIRTRLCGPCIAVIAGRISYSRQSGLHTPGVHFCPDISFA